MTTIGNDEWKKRYILVGSVSGAVRLGSVDCQQILWICDEFQIQMVQSVSQWNTQFYSFILQLMYSVFLTSSMVSFLTSIALKPYRNLSRISGSTTKSYSFVSISSLRRISYTDFLASLSLTGATLCRTTTSVLKEELNKLEMHTRSHLHSSRSHSCDSRSTFKNVTSADQITTTLGDRKSVV